MYSDFFRGKLFSGPMVRASQLPFRLTCLEYGADGVYGPATSCESILISHKLESDPNCLVFGWPDKPYVHFRTNEKEKGKLVFQLLAHDPVQAIKAAEVIAPFSAAIDLNCGCPENFATSKGNGSALMNDPQTVSEIISALSRNFQLPISVKHRIHYKIEDSIQFAKACENAGASAVALHGRRKEQKHKGAVAYDDMKLVFEHISCAKIGNGGVKSRQSAREMMDATGCESVIISSQAIKNPSCFSEEPKDPLDVARRYLEIAEENGCEDRREWRWLLVSLLGKYRNFSKSPVYNTLTEMTTIAEFKELLSRDNPFPLE